MLEIQALTYNDLPPVMAVGGRIPKEGGTVGRGADNALVLPDPIKTVSRTHLNFTPRSGSTYHVTNVSNRIPVIINDRILQPGQKRVLRDGARIMIGSYVLEARYTDANEAEAPAVANDEKASLQRAKPDSLPEPAPKASSVTPELDDDDPFARPQESEREPLQAFANSGIGLETLVGKSDSLINDESANVAVSELFQDPLTSIAGAGLTSADKNSLDPLAYLGGDDDGEGVLSDIFSADKKKGVKPPTMNVSHGSELNSLFQAPQARELRADAETALSSDAQASADNVVEDDHLGHFFEGFGSDSVASPDEPPVSCPVTKDDEKPLPVPGQEASVEDDGVADEAAAVRPKAEPRKTSGKAKSAAAGLSEAAPAQSVEDSPPAQTRATPPRKGKRTRAGQEASFTVEELYAALIEGLDIGDLPNRNALDPDFMRLIGQLLRSYTQGTVNLITSRAVIRQEVRAIVTMIAPEGNNQLKFSPDAGLALLHMLGQRVSGFLGPLESVQEAFDDLYVHQIGVVSGMQSALEHVLDRFDPEAIEKETPRRFPGQFLEFWHKAELWDAYGRYYRKTRASAVDHFQSFLGAAFLAAYEKVIAEQAGDGDEP